MANVKVTVSGPNCFFSTIMDETAVAAYVAGGKSAGYFESPDSDIFIPWENSSVVINAETFTQATRDEIENFGPTQ